MTLFNPLIQTNNNLSGVQKYLLRVILGWAGKTILHGERLAEVTETHTAIRQLHPLMESDLSESTDDAFWIPRSKGDRKHSSLDTQTIEIFRDYFRPKSTQPETAHSSFRRVKLYSRFPSPSYLLYLVTKLGYDSDAAFAVFARSWGFHRGRPDRRRKKPVGGADRQTTRQTRRDYQRFDYGDNLYVPESPNRRTLTGGGFSKEQVHQGLAKMRTDRLIKAALSEIVYLRRSTLEVSNKTGIPVEILYVYASRLRERIRRESEAVAA